mgnify:CR=1 FL=1
MKSLTTINILGIILLIFAIPIKYVTVSIMAMALIGMGAGIIETLVLYTENDEKEGQILIIGIISLTEILIGTSIIEDDIIKHTNLNTSNTVMYEFVTSMLKVPAGTEIIYQIGIFLGLVIFIISLAGILKKRIELKQMENH